MNGRDADVRLRDLTSRLGFGDGITEPQAPNDVIVDWIEEQLRDADEWRESQAWRVACYEAGHPEDEDCHEHDPALRLIAAESRARDLEAENARLRALLAEDVALLEELDAAWGGAGGAGS